MLYRKFLCASFHTQITQILKIGVILSFNRCNHFPRLNVLCSALTAISAYLESTTQEIFISDVLIIIIFMFSFDNAANIFAAAPEWLLIPTPTIDTFAIFSSNLTSWAPILLTSFFVVRSPLFASDLGTVNDISVNPLSLTFWIIISTLTP